MKTEDTVEYNSLKWVKKELDLILQEAQTSFSAYIEEPEAESDRLNECIEHLHMVQGTLQMVELFGAAQLAEEMEHVAQALADGGIDKKDDAYDVLMRAMLQLPDYLESLQAGSKDVPMILLPLLNDLRASRHASLLSENVLFFPNVDVSDDSEQFAAIEKGRLLPMAKKLRPHYQVGLLGWFKGQKIAASLKRILAVLSELEKNSADPATRRIWSIGAALVEGLANGGIDSSVSIKMLLGHVDRSIKQLIDQGEDVFARSVSPELLKNLLYYIARIDKDSQRVNSIKELYHLDELLPGDKELEEARSGLGGLNTELLKTVSQGIREELLEVKDILELFVHSEARDVGRLSTLPDLLNKIADTLAMLGLGGPREDVLTQRKKIESIVSGGTDASEDEIMEIASVLLNVEAQLNNFIANRSIQGAGTTELETDMPEGEYRDVVSAVVREALQDFSDARQAILGFLEDTTNTDLLRIVLTRLDQVNGAMFMMPVQHIESEIHALRDYIIKVLLNAGEVPDATMQDRMADVVTGIEYYLESIIEGRPRSLESSEIAARALDEVSSSYADVDEVELLAPAEESVPEKPKETVEPAAAQVEQSAPVSAADQAAPVAAASELDKGYVILGDDADEEILEIFIEEALEELASLNEQFPRWKNNIADEEALTTIRRSFHTLKGSGRLIGAELIGEFAWNFENMLNRVLDKSRPADQDVFDVLEEALGILPQLIEQLTGNREPVENVYELMARADALGKWSKTDRAKVSEAATRPTVEPEINEVAPEPIITEEDSIAELETTEPEIGFSETPEPVIEFEPEAELPLMDVEDEAIDMSAVEAENDEISLADFDIDEPSPAESLDDDFDIDLTDDLESLQLAMSPTDTESEITETEIDLTENNGIEADGLEFDAGDLIPENYEPEAEADINVDPVLFQIFKDESEGHLKQIRLLLDSHYQGEQQLIAGPELNRALHTLFGSARTAEVQAIAEICGEAEKYIRLYQDMDSNIIQDEGVSLIDELSQSVTSMLELMSDPGKRLQSDTVLLSRIQSAIRDLSQQLEAQAVGSSQTIEDLTIEQPAEEVVPEIVAEPKPVPQPEISESLVAYGDVDDELVDIFLEEAEELLDACENCLQRWSSNSADSNSVQDLQRQLHTLKGGARMADLTPIGNLTHALESLIIAVTEGRVGFSKDMDNILHESMDNLSDMLAKVKTREPMSSAERLISLLEALKRGEAVDLKKNETEGESVAEIQDVAEPALEDFSIEIEDEAASVDTLVFDESELDLTAEVPAAEESFEIEIEPTADVELEIEEPELEDQADEIELDLNEFIKQEDKAAKEQMQKAAEQEVAKPKDEPAKSGTQEQVRVRAELLNELVNNAGEVSVYHARMNQQIAGFSFSLTEMEQTVERLREQLRKLSIETEAQILSRYEKESDQYDADFDPLEMDRFSTMQQISRSLQETVSDIESIKDILGESVRDAETLLLQESRVSTELQEGLMRTRMVHFGGLASRLRRIVRQTARELDKDVELEISGESSEVDRTVLDRIIAPLEHMLRNAVSHGIESPEQRLAAGKSESGKITIGVDREGGDVVIKVDDDGRGIDVKAVRDKAIAQGLMERDSQLTDHEILQFIMHAGFSTAEKVTQISGRGVGMDVVDSEIKQLGGLLEIDTAQGKGSTFKIRLPLTLAINHALMVSAGEEVYAVPLNSIEGVVRLSGPELQMFYDSDNSKYEFAGVKYELRHLGKMLTGTQPDYSRSGQLYPVLLAHVGDHYVALHVDDLLGRREIVVKPVGSQIGNVRSISGATILGDGRVVLILEMNSLVLGDSLIHIEETEGLADQAAVPQVPVAETREPIVMVVDDSITIRKVTERMLGRHNMKVITAKDGVDAVAQLQDIKPDVMLLDIEMPRMDGYEVASHVRNEERLKDLPIIMITSRSGAKHKDKAFEIGVNKYLGKPYQEDELMENIHELIG